MLRLQYFKSALVAGASIIALANPAAARVFDIPQGDLAAALDAYSDQSGVQLMYSESQVRGHRSNGAKGQYTETAALSQLLSGSGFAARMMPSNTIGIIPVERAAAPVAIRLAQAARRAPAAAPMAPTVETVVVTAQHKSENIQSVPISITALSQQQLTDRQVAAGPDLVKEVPNLTFSKTNFSGYNLEIRGIGTQAISVTTDPAVAVAFNDIPFIRNHFFEQEFFDVGDVEVLRGPQGTLYGRNATAGVVNIKSALPVDSYEAMISADIGNYSNRRLEGMLNLPIVGDTLDLRIAGEWTKREGYTTDTTLDVPVDGRDLWSGRMTLGWKPASNVQTYLVWEHFSEDDDRLRSGKQTCETDPSPTEVDGVPVPTTAERYAVPGDYLSQGCSPASLYSPQAFEVPNGNVLPYYNPLEQIGAPLQGGDSAAFDPYASATQSTNLRDIESALLPTYKAKNDTLEFNADWNVTADLTFTSQTGYNNDFLWSTEDYNRFDTAPGAFAYTPPDDGLNTNALGTVTLDPLAGTDGIPSNAGVFCDPQLGCSDRLLAEDLSEERAWQFSQEFRLASNFSGPLNFSAGGNFLHYETVEDYYVFINTITLTQGSENFSGSSTRVPWVPGVSDNHQCLQGGLANVNPYARHLIQNDTCGYIDPNPITSLNGEGHNYFLSQNPYVLNSYALFGEAYYDIAPDLKFTAGARWTVDEKHFIDIPSEFFVPGYGYPVTDMVDQRWSEPTGRAVLNWTPDLDFTDQTLIYGSAAHGYKAGGANPPGAVLLSNAPGDISFPDHPLTFRPEYIEAFELGTKNSLLDRTLTLNGDVFYYNYTGYQISEIVDRTAINNNYNAHIEGSEIEADWEPLPGLKFNFAGGYEDAQLAGGSQGIDLMDRADLAQHPDWMVVKPFPTQASNCILPTSVVAALLNEEIAIAGNSVAYACDIAYNLQDDPLTRLPYVANPTQTQYGEGYIPPGYPGFNPASAPNNGEGFDKNLSGNQLPNAPHFTTSFTAEYSMPVSDDWVGTLHGDFYWQSQSWARVFNDNPYDKLRGYSTTNLSLILTSANGWQVMGYVKNLFNVTAITGDFLNSDDSGLTTNVFLTDPRLYGIRVTKHLDQDDGFWGSDHSGNDFFTGLFSDADHGKPPLWITLGGNFDQLSDGHQLFDPPFLAAVPSKYGSQLNPQNGPALGLDWETKVSFQPDDSDWVFSASARYGRASRNYHVNHQTNLTRFVTPVATPIALPYQPRYLNTQAQEAESHAVLDFMAGKNVGLGMLGLPGTSVLSAGARYAAFTSKSVVDMFGAPDSASGPTGPKYRYHRYSGAFDAARSFHGIGPALDWNASTPLMGNEQGGELAVDWGSNGAVLFGRQRAAGMQKTVGAYYCSNRFGRRATACPTPTPNAHATRTAYRQIKIISNYQRAKSFNRSRMVTVPNLGGFVGLSMRYNNAKVSFGYRADEFFGAMDGGIDTYKSYNRGFFGPYANISVGLGG